MAYRLQSYRYDTNGQFYSDRPITTVDVPVTAYLTKKKTEGLFYINRYGMFSLLPATEQWIKENIKGGYRFDFKYSAYNTARFYFTQESSAILFKLRYA